MYSYYLLDIEYFEYIMNLVLKYVPEYLNDMFNDGLIENMVTNNYSFSLLIIKKYNSYFDFKNNNNINIFVKHHIDNIKDYYELIKLDKVDFDVVLLNILFEQLKNNKISIWYFKKLLKRIPLNLLDDNLIL
jgi:hypothetical protein